MVILGCQANWILAFLPGERVVLNDGRSEGVEIVFIFDEIELGLVVAELEWPILGWKVGDLIEFVGRRFVDMGMIDFFLGLLNFN